MHLISNPFSFDFIASLLTISENSDISRYGDISLAINKILFFVDIISNIDEKSFQKLVCKGKAFLWKIPLNADFRRLNRIPMLILKTADGLSAGLDFIRKRKRIIGFVPTMGALHEGHLSLIEESRKHNDCTVCSIFVNPTQFNDPADYKKYPVTREADIHWLEREATDVLFLPYTETIYPGGTAHLRHYELGPLEHILEGKYRPGHFQGVCQVMHRLLQLVGPDNLYMGQKDYQQCMVVGKLLQLTGLETRLHTCATRREPGGLAMSSRNKRLSNREKEQAVALSQALLYIKEHLQPGNPEPIKQEARKFLDDSIFRIDYLEIADARTLEPVSHWDGRTPLVALIAAFLGEVRLIDNFLITDTDG